MTNHFTNVNFGCAKRPAHSSYSFQGLTHTFSIELTTSVNIHTPVCLRQDLDVYI
jgi:hypothetical protein